VNIDRNILKSGAALYGVALSDVQLDKFEKYCSFLLETNQKFNLTAITNPDEVTSKHFCDSLAARLVVDFAGARNLIDIGAGAGLPGFALKIAYPNLALTAVESIGKKARFLEELSDVLELENVVVYNERAENVIKTHPECAGKFDVATARAVGNIEMLLGYAKPLLRKSGTLLLWKSRDEVAELPSLQKLIEHLGFQLAKTYPYRIPLWSIDRFLVELIRL
jgi:16S rRNA (guanine(527)-N(7))-methyltransferase RsmG